MDRRNSKRIVILGAGLAGLTCAYELIKAGKKVTILEKLPEVGGMAKTIKVNSFKFDTGPHRWYTKNDMVNKWMLKLLNKEIIKVPRLTRIYFDKKFFHYPIKIKSTLLGMGIIKTVRAVLDYLFIRIYRIFDKKEPITIEEGYIYQFGKSLYEMFFKRYTEKLWGTSCKNISADWLNQRSRGFNITTIIKNALFKSGKVVSFVDEFCYPKEGIGRLPQKMAEEVKRGGGEILLNSDVVGINHKKNIINSISVRNKDGIKEIAVDEVVSTIPLSDLIFNLHPQVTKNILNINKKLKYRDEVQVVLLVNKTKITPDTWIYVHSLDMPFVRFMEMDNWSSSLSPKGKTAIVFEITCNEGDKIWTEKDEKLVSWIKDKFISEFGLITRDNIIDSYVHRVQKEYPVYHIGYKRDLFYLKDYLKRFKNLQIAGRNGVFRYNNMDHSIEMGLYSAWNIIEGERKFDIELVNIEREYLEEKKIRVKELELPEDQYVEEAKN